VARTVLTKLRETKSVTDFGAVGDGVTDDTAAFNAAQTASTPNPVFVPAGSYAITGTVTGSFITSGVVTIVGGTVTSISTYGLNATINGDLAVNGADITTTATGTATVFNTNATTLNVGGAATTVSLGAATGTTTINNANTVVTGDLAVNGADITTTSTGTATVFNTNATTLNVGGAATTLSLGATTGTASINNATFRFNSGYGSVATAYGCRAWCKFDGTLAGPITPGGSGNVSSVTDNGTGDYTVNFSTALVDTNYSAVASGVAISPSSNTTSGGTYQGPGVDTFATGSVRVTGGSNTGVYNDWPIMCVAVFR
jgi:hypothetical protein